MNKHIIQLILVFFVSIFVANAQKTCTLTFNPKDGSRYDALMDMTNKIVQNVMGQDMEINMNYNTAMTYAIANDAPNKKLSITYEKLKMDMDVMGQKVTMDSDNPDTTNEASKSFKALKGQSIHIVIDPSGNVVKVEGTDAILNSVGNDLMKKETLKGVLGEDAIKTLFQQSFGFYPQKPVKAGDTWTSTIIIKSPYELNYFRL
ncbi:MAG: DUF6263 family protein [Niabella sp.]